MTLLVNGEPRQVPDGLSVTGFLEELSLPVARVAVEHNGVIVPKGRFSEVSLEDGDRLEIVHFVGGG